MSFHPGPFFRNPPHPFHFPPSYLPFPAGWDPSVSLAHPYIYDPTQVKHRRRTTPEQLRILEDTFKTDPKPNAALRKKLSLEIGMTPRVLQVWFQNRRMKVKRMAKKSAESAAPSEPEGSDPADPAPTPNSENHDSPSSPVPSEPSRAATPATDASTAAASAPSPASTSATNTAAGSSLVPPAQPENIRRGSLPTALVSPSSLAPDASLNDTFPSVTDPALVRRRSMTSLHRLESHPFAPLVAANNGLGPLPTHTVVPPTPPAFTPSRASFPQYHHHSPSGPAPVQSARLLPTARAASFHFLPSPQHLHAFNVPAQQQQPYAFPPRPLAPPRPGPLPAPDYSFGTPPAPLPQQQDESVDVRPYMSAFAAAAMPRLSAGGDDDTDTEYSSRFGSIASDASSASAWAAVAPSSDGEQRRGSWSTGHVADMLSGLAVAGGGPAKDANHLWAHGAGSTESLVYPDDALDHSEGAASASAAATYDAAGRYGDSTAIAVKFEDPPTSFVSAGPASAAVAAGQRDLPISQSSELAFALCGTAQAAIACGGGDQQPLDLH